MTADRPTPDPIRPARVELHCHLDGSVRPDTIAELARAAGRTLPGPVRELAVAPARPTDLMQYLTRIDVALSVLQTAEGLRRAAYELVEDWHADGVVHGEVRFAPQLHEREGLTMAAALAAVTRGLAEGRARFGVGTGTILCCLRQQPPEVSLGVARLAVDNRDAVAALDLAGDESRPGRPHLAAFRLAHDAGLPVTIHAGEAAGPDSVREALDVLGAHRIGHGVRCVEDAGLTDRLVREAVPLETCPTSNVQTGAVSRFAAHPAVELLRRGAHVTVSTDARTVSDTTVTREEERLRSLGFTDDDARQAWLNAARAAFLPAADRAALVARVSGAAVTTG